MPPLRGQSRAQGYGDVDRIPWYAFGNARERQGRHFRVDCQRDDGSPGPPGYGCETCHSHSPLRTPIRRGTHEPPLPALRHWDSLRPRMSPSSAWATRRPPPCRPPPSPSCPFDDALAHTSPPVRGPARVRIATQGYDRRDRGAARATRLRTGKEQADARLARTGGHQARHRALPRQAPRRQPLPAPAQGGVSAPPSMAIAAAPPMAPTPSHGHPSARRAAVTPATVAAGGDRSRSHGVFRPALWRCEDNWEGTLRLFARYLDIHRSALVSYQRFIRYE